MKIRVAACLIACLGLTGCNQDNLAEVGVDTTIKETQNDGETIEQVANKPAQSNGDTILAEAGLELSDKLVLANPALCEYDKVTERAFTNLLSYNWETGAAKTSDMVVVGQQNLKTNLAESSDASYEGSRIITASARFRKGTMWNGLKISRIVKEQGLYPESDGYETKAITFINSPSEVQNAFNAIGIEVPISPDYRELFDEACGGSMQINTIDGGASLSCGFGC